MQGMSSFPAAATSQTESPTNTTRSAASPDCSSAATRMSGAGLLSCASADEVTESITSSTSSAARSAVTSCSAAEVASTTRSPRSAQARSSSRAPGSGASRSQYSA